MLQNVLLACASNRLKEHATSMAIQACVTRGAGFIEVRDIGDVSVARNIQLSLALRAMRENRRFEQVLMIDDDMAFRVEDVTALTSFVQQHMLPASGAYVLGDGRMAAQHLAGDRWLTGLGFVSIPLPALEMLASESREFYLRKGDNGKLWEFTRSCADREENGDWYWEPEDFRLTRRLGGVVLLSLPISHIKKRELRPSGDELPGFIARQGRDIG